MEFLAVSYLMLTVEVGSCLGWLEGGLLVLSSFLLSVAGADLLLSRLDWLDWLDWTAPSAESLAELESHLSSTGVTSDTVKRNEETTSIQQS